MHAPLGPARSADLRTAARANSSRSRFSILRKPKMRSRNSFYRIRLRGARYRDRRRWHCSRVRCQLLGVHEPVYRGYTIWRGLARLHAAMPTGSNSETWGRGKRFGILNTRRRAVPHGTLRPTPEPAISTRPKAVKATFCGCSRAGMSRSKRLRLRQRMKTTS